MVLTWTAMHYPVKITYNLGFWAKNLLIMPTYIELMGRSRHMREGDEAKYIKVLHNQYPSLPQFASAVTGSRGPRPWRGFTHGPQTTAKCPLRVRMQPDHELGNGMGRVDMERGPDSV